MTPAASRQPDRFAEPAAAPVAAQASLLDEVLAATATAAAIPARTAAADALHRFLQEADSASALRAWLGGTVSDRWRADPRRGFGERLSADIALIDGLLTDQLNAILHHPDFQKLEASWRGLLYLVDQVPEEANIKVRVMNATWRDLVKDQERALEFDQSQLFRKIYNDEFGTPGGEPFGLLVGNYEICHRPFPDHPTDDLAILNGIAGVAAASFAPFVAGVDPRFLEVESFADLEQPFDLARTFNQLDFVKWRQFREAEDSRFIGLVMPRVVYRAPYGDEPGRAYGFRFVEDVSAPDRTGYLWGNAAFAFAAVAVRSFAETAWLAEIRGARAGEDRAGLIVGLPAIGYGTGSGESPRSVTDAHLTDAREKELAELGFIPLCHTPGAAEAAFYTTPSAQKPRTFAEAAANANARLSAMLQYMLCVGRFAHYLKVLIRDQVGGFTSAGDIEDRLQKWLRQYVIGNDNASQEMKARFPLRDARVQVRELDGKPGSYQCSIQLRPHFQLDQLSAGIRLTTQLKPRAVE